MAAVEEQTNVDRQLGLRLSPFSKYVPFAGLLCYQIYSINIMDQKAFADFFGSREELTANLLWLNSHVGIGWYLFHSRHLQELQLPWRVTYAVFGATMFNFGSVLMWGVSKLVLMSNASPVVKIVYGLCSGCVFLCVGKMYKDHVDSLVVKS